MAEQKKWVVTASDDDAGKGVADALRATGFEVEQELTEIGVVIGHSTEAVAKSIRDLPGVSDVSADEPVDIGPPGAPDTW